jgi:general stress protein 26
MTRSDPATRAWDMLESFRFCMLVTQAEGRPHARPMSHIAMRDERLLYILTDRTSASAREIAAHSDVLLTFTDGGNSFLSLAARATISADRALVRRLWNTGAQAFWPEGPEQPNVVALVIEPQAAEYWDGPNALVAGVKLALAAMTGSTPDFGENRKTPL